MEYNVLAEIKRMTKTNKMGECQILCRNCPLNEFSKKFELNCFDGIFAYPDKALEFMKQWSKKHPIKTRQSELLKMFPNAVININGTIDICPKDVFNHYSCIDDNKNCYECKKDFWLSPIEED